MRKIYYPLLILLAGVVLWSCESQKLVREVVYDKYYETNGISIIALPPNFVNMFVDNKNTDQKELLQTIKDFRIMIFENEIDGKEGETVFQDVNKLLDKRGFEEFMTINKAGSKVIIKAKVKNDLIREMHVLIAGKEKLIMASLTGKIDMNKAAKTMQDLDFDDYSKMEGITGKFDLDDLKLNF